MALNWKAGRHDWDLSGRGLIMGILNLTPDSFSDGDQYQHPEVAVEHALQMVEEGAEILDLGGESTRPGAEPVPLEEELRRVLPVLKLLRRQTGVAISIDTYKAETARQSLEAGADIINDISALRADPAMAGVAASSGCGLILMHMQGRPKTMQEAPVYGNVVGEVRNFLLERAHFAQEQGVSRGAICLDPGFGFGKSPDHNRQLLKHLEKLAEDSYPILIGISRKSYLAAVTGEFAMEDRLWPGVTLTSFCREKGARIFRVHDVLPNLHALRMTESILQYA